MQLGYLFLPTEKHVFGSNYRREMRPAKLHQVLKSEMTKKTEKQNEKHVSLTPNNEYIADIFRLHPILDRNFDDFAF